MRTHAFAIAVVASCLTTMLAHAQQKLTPVSAAPSPGMDGALLGQAKKLHAEGMVHRLANRDEEAYAAFAAAWAIMPHYRVAGPLGATEFDLKKYRDAAEHLRFYLEHVTAEDGADEKVQARKLLTKATAQVVELAVTVEPADADVKVNGVAVNVGLKAFYEPGMFTILVSRDGYDDLTKKTDFEAGTQRQLALIMVAKRTVQPPEHGPDARVVAGIAIGVGALVGFGVGIGGSVAASGYTDDAAGLRAALPMNSCTPPLSSGACSMLAQTVDEQNAAFDVSVGGYVSGVALGALSAGLLAWWAQDDDGGGGANVAIVPLVDGDNVGVMIGGSW